MKYNLDKTTMKVFEKYDITIPDWVNIHCERILDSASSLEKKEADNIPEVIIAKKVEFYFKTLYHEPMTSSELKSITDEDIITKALADELDLSDSETFLDVIKRMVKFAKDKTVRESLRKEILDKLFEMQIFIDMSIKLDMSYSKILSVFSNIFEHNDDKEIVNNLKPTNKGFIYKLNPKSSECMLSSNKISLSENTISALYDANKKIGKLSSTDKCTSEDELIFTVTTFFNLYYDNYVDKEKKQNE